MATCLQCGAENPNDRQVCETCGAPLNADQESGPVGSLPPGPISIEAGEQQTPPQPPSPVREIPTGSPLIPPPMPVSPPVVGQPYGYGGPGTNAQPQSQLSLWSMILGIASIVIGCCCYSGLLLGPAAIVLGVMARKDQTANQSMATAGIITGILGTLFPLAMIVFMLFSSALHLKAPDQWFTP
ncbi:MAG: DUF4190 domain-containing protein [Armatimonadota bacterium]